VRDLRGARIVDMIGLTEKRLVSETLHIDNRIHALHTPKDQAGVGAMATTHELRLRR
jgi:hypothetical protein